MTVALCFPGQGSQAAGMATPDLLQTPLASTLLDAASARGIDLRSALAGDDDTLRPTEIAQPALLLVEVVLAAEVQSRGVTMVGVAGHSVGEYAALVAAGALDATQAMILVVERGRAMAAMRRGGMVALLGAEVDLAEAICAEVTAAGAGTLVVANVNAPGQVVLSGDEAALAAVPEVARRQGVRRTMPLNVSGAFHSPLMAQAAEHYAVHLDAVTLRDAAVPVACNVDGAAVQDAAGLRDRLRRQLTAPVRWVDCVTTVVGLGADTLLEVGPGGVLSALARRIAPEVRTVTVSTPEQARDVDARVAAAHG